MTRAVSAALLLVTLSVAAEPAVAFTAKTRALIVRRAVSLMPDSLQRQMRRHARPLLAHALAGRARIPAEGLQALDPGDADARLAAEVDAVVEAIGSREPMSAVAARFGEVARTTSDLAFALNVGPNDPREAGFYADFARFVESRLDRIRIVFDGFHDPALARGDVRAFARRIAARARRDYGGIVASYHPEGREATAGDFDDRSVAFAAASLEVSLAVTATARAWLHAWRRVHGDMEGAPLDAPGWRGPQDVPDSGSEKREP
jgi:hypothetical protein